MRRRAAALALALLLGSCAHRSHVAAPAGAPPPAAPPAATTPAPPATAPAPVAITPAPPAANAPPRGHLRPPKPPPRQTQHPPLWLMRGAVVDARSGRVLENAAVRVMARRDTSGSDAIQPSIATGADGRFTLDFPAPGEYPLKVAALGYQLRTTMVRVGATGNVPYRVFRLAPLASSRDTTAPAPGTP